MKTNNHELLTALALANDWMNSHGATLQDTAPIRAAISEYYDDPLDPDAGVEDSPCVESASRWGSDEGQFHGVM